MAYFSKSWWYHRASQDDTSRGGQEHWHKIYWNPLNNHQDTSQNQTGLLVALKQKCVVHQSHWDTSYGDHEPYLFKLWVWLAWLKTLISKLNHSSFIPFIFLAECLLRLSVVVFLLQLVSSSQFPRGLHDIIRLVMTLFGLFLICDPWASSSSISSCLMDFHKCFTQGNHMRRCVAA